MNKENVKELANKVVAVAKAFSPDTEDVYGQLYKAVVEAATPYITADTVAVQYIGKRPTYVDGLFGTKTTWKQGEIKNVPETIARNMFKHPDVYIPAVLPEVKSEKSIKAIPRFAMPTQPITDHENIETVTIPDEVKKLTEDDRQAAKDSILNMRRKAPIIEFAKQNFSGVELDGTKTVDYLQQEAIQMIDQYGLTG